MRNNNYCLYDYVLKNLNLSKEFVDLIKYEIDKRVYFYGNHLANNYEKQSKIKIYLYFFLKTFFFLKNKGKVKKDIPMIISSAYFNFNSEFEKNNYEISFPEINVGNRNSYIGNFQILLKYEYIKFKFKNGNLNQIMSAKFIKTIDNFKSELKKHIIQRDVKALILANDMGFLEKILIAIFKEINRPSFIFLHGLPSRYNGLDDNRADYLLVWGNKIKENYINVGVNEKKILVTGHPTLSNKFNNSSLDSLKFSFENVLVVTNSISPIPENSDKVILQDRGNSLLFLYSIKNVLQKFNIKSVRLRPHPSEERSWYYNNIDNDFFRLDSENIKDSLINSTLVIGPTSTLLLDSISLGVNYVVYEPTISNLSIKMFEFVPPFDKSDSRIIVSNNETELSIVLKEKVVHDLSFINDYINKTFDLSAVFSILR